MTEMMLASWETIARRTSMITRDTCTPAEYRRMVIEKVAALQRSTLAVMSGRGTRAVLAPWHLARYSECQAPAEATPSGPGLIRGDIPSASSPREGWIVPHSAGVDNQSWSSLLATPRS